MWPRRGSGKGESEPEQTLQLLVVHLLHRFCHPLSASMPDAFRLLSSQLHEQGLLRRRALLTYQTFQSRFRERFAGQLDDAKGAGDGSVFKALGGDGRALGDGAHYEAEELRSLHRLQLLMPMEDMLINAEQRRRAVDQKEEDDDIHFYFSCGKKRNNIHKSEGK